MFSNRRLHPRRGEFLFLSLVTLTSVPLSISAPVADYEGPKVDASYALCIGIVMWCGASFFPRVFAGQCI